MKAILAGTFDPFTSGHLDIVKRASEIFDGVVIAVAFDTGKNTAALSDRENIVRLSVDGVPKVEIVTFSGLLAKFVKDNYPTAVILRGLRGSKDCEYEKELCRIYAGDCDNECVYLFSKSELEHVSSTNVRTIAALNGNLSGLVADSAISFVKKIYGERERLKK